MGLKNIFEYYGKITGTVIKAAIEQLNATGSYKLFEVVDQLVSHVY
jgi:hypothetical protein